MLVVRGTKKLRDRVTGLAAAEGDRSTGALGDWFATEVSGAPQVALAMNARTFVPVFFPLAPAATLLDRMPEAIAHVLGGLGVEPAAVEAELAAMADARIAPTNDRRVVGVMNEFSSLAGHFYDGDLAALSLRLAGTPVGPLRATYDFPDKALAALLPTGPVGEALTLPGMAPPAGGERRRAPTSRLAARPAAGASAFRLKVTLLGTKPPVWRRVLVDGAITLGELHEVIQAAFGWFNYHLHEFEVGSARYGTADTGLDLGFGPPVTDERATRLDAVAGEGSSFHYTYDFGDDWRHKVTVESVTPSPGTTLPACIGGRRACPPEDCGGPWGYVEFLDSPDGARFDPAAFDPADFAFNLATVRTCFPGS